MVPYIPIREKYTNILRLAFSYRLQMRGKNFCHAKTWERRSRNYQLSGESRGSRSHTVFPLKACLHEGGKLQVGKVTCVAMLEKSLLQVHQNRWSQPLRFHQWSNVYNVSTVGLAQAAMPDPHTKQDLLSTITTINTYHEQDHETNQILKAHQQKFMWLHDIPLTL